MLWALPFDCRSPSAELALGGGGRVGFGGWGREGQINLSSATLQDIDLKFACSRSTVTMRPSKDCPN
jgi:hypothetical protein